MCYSLSLITEWINQIPVKFMRIKFSANQGSTKDQNTRK